ncbi:MAG: hypothetical protein RQ745_08145 [Longimicrobiales bacterium]|nr:hypothetical protein [Longimicrobiales bacterium]
MPPRSDPSPHTDSDAPWARLREEIETVVTEPISPDADPLVSAMRARFGDGLRAVLVYGSCLRSGDYSEGLVDLYALVDRYRSAHPGRGHAVVNRLLPPNVYHLQTGPGGEGGEDAPSALEHPGMLRAKFAVLTLDDFERGCTRWFHSYLWARFAQPSRLAWVDGEASRARVLDALAGAVVRFLDESAPLLAGERFEVDAVWQAGLERAYAAELRPERGRAGELVETNRSIFTRWTEAAAPLLPLERLDDAPTSPPGPWTCPLEPAAGRRAAARWRWRRRQGLLLSVARLVKAAWTFDGGIDYVAWKLERHTGVDIEVTPAMRRHPVLLGLPQLMRLMARGTVR